MRRPASPFSRAQHSVDVASVGRAGGPAHSSAGRQCGRCGRCHCELFCFPAAARALRAIAATKGDAFYSGEIAEALERFSNANGGSLKVRDLPNWRPEWVKPISQDYRGHTLHEIPPNGQGIAALIALGILEHFDIATRSRRSICRSRR